MPEPVSVYTVSSAALIAVEGGDSGDSGAPDGDYEPYDNRELHLPTT